MDIKIEPSGKTGCSPSLKKPYFQNLIRFVKDEYATHTVFPPGGKIFQAFDACPFDQVKVVLLSVRIPITDPVRPTGLAFFQ